MKRILISKGAAINYVLVFALLSTYMVNRHISGILSRGAKVVRSFVRDAAKSGKERRKGFPFWTIKTELARSLAQPHSNELESTEGTTGATEIEAGKNGSTHVQ